jgi:hypothetical protein
VREVCFDLAEVIPERREGAMLGSFKKQVEFGPVKLEAVDLAVFKFE